MSEETIASQWIYRGRVVTLRVDTVRLPDGRVSQREVVVHTPAVAIVPVDDQGRILFVRQFRSPLQDDLLEIPAGGVEAGEEPAEAAQRELQEEIGYRAHQIERIAGCYTTPGFCDEFIHIYLARGLHPSTLPGDHDEAIEIVRLSLDEALAGIAAGQICDAKTLIGILYLQSLILSNSAPHPES